MGQCSGKVAVSPSTLAPVTPVAEPSKSVREKDALRRRSLTKGKKFFIEDSRILSNCNSVVRVSKSSNIIDKLKESVKNLPSFENITPEQRDAVLNSMGIEEYKAGDIVCEKNERGTYFSIVCHGEFEILQDKDNGDDNSEENENSTLSSDEDSILKIPKKLKAWDHFGEMALVFEGDNQRTIKAITDGSVYVLDRLTYQRVLVKTATDISSANTSFLSQVPILAPLTVEQREKLADCLVPKKYEKDTFIVHQGERGDTFFLVESGEVAVVERKMKDGKQVEEELKRRGRGWYFGEGALQSEEGVRNADVKAVSTCTCLTLGRREFHDLLGPLHDLINRNFKKRVLMTLDLLKKLNDEQLDGVVDQMVTRVYEDGEYICKQGEAGDTFFIIEEGQVRVTRKEEALDPESSIKSQRRALSPREDEETEIGTLIHGEYFGEGALLTNAPRRANIIATNKVTCITLSREAFENALGPLRKMLDENFNARKGSTSASNVQWSDIQKIRAIGSGSYGTVTIVRHKITGQTYALKQIRKATVIMKKQEKFIRNERNILSKLNHPFIVNLVRTFKDEESVYMLMEICLGGELYAHMKATVDKIMVTSKDEVPGCFPMKTCKFYFGVVALALEYIHSLGIIHRDLKPENLLLTKNGYLKLVDFGFAKPIGVTRTYSLCGTPAYIAPEVYKRAGHGRGVDYWALGVMLYEMASGFSPFHVHSENSWDCYVEIARYAKAYPHVQFPSLFGKHLNDLMLRLLNPNPHKRIGAYRTTSEIKKHPFFKGFKWDDLADMEMEAPYIPPVTHVMDTSNFEEVKDKHLNDGDGLKAKGMMNQSTCEWDKNF